MSDVAPDDFSQPFKLEQSEFRGRYIRLGTVIDHILKRQDYPKKVSYLLGELLVLASAFAGSLKFNGRFSLQVRGEGPIRLMVADCTNDGILRGYASFEESDLDQGDGVELFGEAILSIIVDQSAAGSKTHQGVVEVSARGLAHSVRGYFWQSEQVPTGLHLATSAAGDLDQWNGAALIVQSMPAADVEASAMAHHEEIEHRDDWRQIMMLMETVSDQELLDRSQSATSLLWRLFHEIGVRVFEPLVLAAGCRCSESKVDAVLASFSIEELIEMRTDGGEIIVTCEFCGHAYRYMSSQVDDMIKSRSH